VIFKGINLANNKKAEFIKYYIMNFFFRASGITKKKILKIFNYRPLFIYNIESLCYKKIGALTLILEKVRNNIKIETVG